MMSNENDKESESNEIGYSSDSSDSFSKMGEETVSMAFETSTTTMKEPQKEEKEATQYEEKDPDLVNLQRVDPFVRQLPYFEETKLYAFKSFADIKRNLAESIIYNEIRPGFTHWTNQLIVFVHEYGLFFTKSEHIQLIKLYLGVLQTPHIDLPTVDFCFAVLFELLKKYDKITRKDLVIEWRPIYKLYMRFHKINECSSELVPENMETGSFSNFIRYARIYFDENATKEMLEEWRPMLCPFDSSMASAFERFKLFLPTIFYEHELNSGYQLWLTEFITIWTSLDNRQHWESYFLSLVARLAVDNAGEIDWSPYIPFIFSNVLKGFGLPFGSKDSLALGVSTTIASFNMGMSQMFVYQSEDVLHMCSWIVSMIGCSRRQDDNTDVCMEHIKKLFLALRSFFYPSNTGSWSSNLFLFLKCLPEALIKRIKKEKRERSKWYHRTIGAEKQIRNSDVTDFVEAMRGVVFTAIFSKSNHGDAKKAFQYLTFLRGEIMLPPLVDMIYESLESLTEPHRYTSILSVLVAVSRELATYNRFHKPGQQTQMHVIQLMTAILPGLDPNDANKCLLTLHYLYNSISCILLCDCQPALNYRQDLSEHERELAFETNKFEDFIHEFFKRVFYIVDILASDISADSSASAAAASNQFSITKSNNENIYQAQLIQTLRVLVRQSSKGILKIITQKLKNYINGNTFNTRSGRILANVISYLCSVKSYGATAFETFFNYCYENLSKIRDSKTYETFKHNERGDIEISWNLQLFSEILKSYGYILLPHMSRISQVIGWYRETIHKETISYISNAYRNVIHSLSTIYPIESASVSYDIVFDDEKEFFTKHLPIRDWAATTDVYHLDINYHIPSVKELDTAVEFTEAALNESMSFLTRSIVNNEASKKEERNRELNYINHIVFGAARLLKRPARNTIPNLIDTSLQLGISDDIKKGLGFETTLFDDPNHEYSKLSERNKKTMASLRENVIEFLIMLTDKIVENFANETPLLMLISRILCTSSVTYGFFVNEFEKAWKNFYSNKNSLQNRLLGKKNSLRPELIYRIMLQYQYRTFYLHTRLNELDVRIIDVLFRLATNSIYAVVRRDAQSQLFSLLAHYPYSTSAIVPGIVSLLRGYNEETDDALKNAKHDQLKGCLYLLLGNSVQDSLMIKQNWNILSVLWPQVFKCQSFEKPSIQTLLEKIYAKTDKDFDSFDNRVQFGADIVRLAADLVPSVSFDEKSRLARFEQKSIAETETITKMLEQLLNIAKQQTQLHWKNQANSFHTVLFLLHNCVRSKALLSVEMVQLFVDSLLSDNSSVRKISIDGLCIILKMTKPVKQTRRVKMLDIVREKTGLSDANDIYVNRPRPGYRLDNQWHLFDPNYVDTTTSEATESERAKWNESTFMEKSYWGYYCWPTEMNVALSKRDWYVSENSDSESSSFPPSETSYQRSMKPLVDRFRYDAEFVKKLIRLSIIEEAKGDEKFDKKRFYLFKALFRNFGCTEIIHSLFEHLETLITDKDTNTHECSHKLAAEMMSALIRGSKSWPLERLKPLWQRLKPLLDKLIDNITTDNVKLWYNCFSNSFEDQDPRRLVFYINFFTQLTLRMFSSSTSTTTLSSSTDVQQQQQQISSIQQASCLQFVSAFNQFEWKVPKFWNSVVDLFMANMNHPYKSIREKNSSCLCLAHVTELDTSMFGKNDSAESVAKIAPLNSKSVLQKLIKFIEEKMRKDIELFDYVNEDNIENSEQSKEETKDEAKKTQQQTAVNYLQSIFAWFGYFILKSYQPINELILSLLPQLCSSDKIAAQEATVKSQLAMSRMAISMWILNDECSNSLITHLDNIIQYKSWHSRLAALQILQNFGIFNIFLVKESVRTLVKKIVVNSLVDEQLEVRIAASLALTGFIHSHLVVVNQELIDHLKLLSKTKPRKKDKESDKMVINLPNLVKRHGGILGLCSIVNSCPYDVPPYLPDVLTYLCQFTNDPVPIQASVRKCLSEFRRTHHDNWQQHKQCFDENQLSTLADILISPNYYA